MTEKPITEEFTTPFVVLTEDPRREDSTPLECTACGDEFKPYEEGPPALIPLRNERTNVMEFAVAHNTAECLNAVI